MTSQYSPEYVMSPDPNPNEHLWDVMEQETCTAVVQLTNLLQLCYAHNF